MSVLYLGVQPCKTSQSNKDFFSLAQHLPSVCGPHLILASHDPKRRELWYKSPSLLSHHPKTKVKHLGCRRST